MEDDAHKQAAVLINAVGEYVHEIVRQVVYGGSGSAFDPVRVAKERNAVIEAIKAAVK